MASLFSPPSVLPDPALRLRFGRSSFEKPNRWLFVAFGDHSSPPPVGEMSGRTEGGNVGLNTMRTCLVGCAGRSSS